MGRMAASMVFCVGGLFLSAPSPARAADPVNGEALFMVRCQECHEVTGAKVKIGPPLAGLFGRTSGTVEGFAYSEAMTAARVVWDEATLGRYLEKPKAFIPQNRMNFNGLKRPGEKEDIIAYLKAATAP